MSNKTKDKDEGGGNIFSSSGSTINVQSGGIDLARSTSGSINIDADVVGRDKVVSVVNFFGNISVETDEISRVFAAIKDKVNTLDINQPDKEEVLTSITSIEEETKKDDLGDTRKIARNLKMISYISPDALTIIIEMLIDPQLRISDSVREQVDSSKAYLASNAVLSGVDLRNAVLSGVDLQNAQLQRAVLSGVDLSNANLSHSNFESADLRGANLVRANLREANLRGAQLLRTDFSEADLSGADLSMAILTEAKLDRVIYDKKTKWPANYAPLPKDDIG
jgi:hypothetical protein